jgi:hypothetical protein
MSDNQHGVDQKLTELTVEELQSLYRQEIGRETRSSHRGYLVWKLREARKGRIPIGPVPRRYAPGEGPPIKVLPLRLEARVVSRLDEARERLGFRNRMEFFRIALADYLAGSGEPDVAQLLRGES